MLAHMEVNISSHRYKHPETEGQQDAAGFQDYIIRVSQHFGNTTLAILSLPKQRAESKAKLVAGGDTESGSESGSCHLRHLSLTIL